MALLCVSDCEEKNFIAISSGKELLIAEENKRQLPTHTHTHTHKHEYQICAYNEFLLSVLT